MKRLRRLEYDRVRDELRRYPGPQEDILDCWEWRGKIVIGRWRWLLKRIQFWRYKVVRIQIAEGPPHRFTKVLWRYR